MTLRRIRSGSFPLKALLAALLIGMLFGIADVGEPLENAMKLGRFKLRDHPASGEIVLVAVDDRSIAEHGQMPWNGNRVAELLDHARNAGADRVHLDVPLPAAGGSADARRLEASIAAAEGAVTLPARFSVDGLSERSAIVPLDSFARHARLVNTNLFVWWDDVIWQHPYGAMVGDRVIPSLSASLGGITDSSEQMFPVDYGIDVRSVPVVSADDLLSRRVTPGSLRGKSVVIARTDIGANQYRAPGTGLVPAVLIHIVAAETLLAGAPINLGWFPPLLLGLALAWAILRLQRRWVLLAVIGLAGLLFFAGPLLLEIKHIHIEVMPALAAIITVVGARALSSAMRSYQKRGTINIVTGMPNLQALRNAGEQPDTVVVTARVKNYAHIATTLPAQHEKDLVEQIVARLKFGTGSPDIYQADEGVFVWLSTQPGEDSVIQQLEGLHALFRSPIVIASRIIDLAVTFGLDADGSRTVLQRVSSSLVAADEAARDGKRWASFNPASLEDAEWSMSLLARLDHAIDHGELWVAYQPKLDCRSGDILGAEALVRWTHPEKGQVFPDQFIGAAEQGGRIERLTEFVLDTAIGTAAKINAGGRRFSIAVNLSAVLLGNDSLVPLVEGLLRKHRLSPFLLTLEVTETSTMGSEAKAIANLRRLTDIGVELSIDDYGTGFSTLEYLRRIPASEIKIDRSFVTMLHTSQSDRIMVNSTIQLAHSLGRKVVAEGVESQEILDHLRHMRCDFVQGYHTGRPVPLSALLALLKMKMGRRAA
ncbi:MAG: EAL domain-containing protein [Allosphingosinicella sp.]|uniref:EAL domain-containing protein n=1 Tax=Allosphingosinicella sp. TaxID=2823234 RepID=UPI00394A3478